MHDDAPDKVVSEAEAHSLAGAARIRARVDVAIERARTGSTLRDREPDTTTLTHQFWQKHASTTIQSFLCGGYLPAMSFDCFTGTPRVAR